MFINSFRLSSLSFDSSHEASTTSESTTTLSAMPPHRQPRRKTVPPAIHHHHHHHHQHFHSTTKTYINGALSLSLPTQAIPKRLTLHISAYTSHTDLPATACLTVHVPRGTRSVVELAERIDAAYEHPRTIDWARMIAQCGVQVGGWTVRTDADVGAWMQRGGEPDEEAWLCG